MTSSQRIIVNTAAQYTRTIINVCLSLYSTRLILAVLGQNDYGVFSIVGGVVAMLSFVTNALVGTTQRFLSYHHGKKDFTKIYSIFGNSILLHVFIGIIFVIILSALEPLLIYHFLNIDIARQDVAAIVYFSAIGMLFLSLLTAPFRALFIARENIVYTSIIDICDGIIKVVIAILLTHLASGDKLAIYAILLIGISCFNLFAFSIYAFRHFEECHFPKLSEIDKTYLQQISSYATWILYSTGCVIGRTQGVAIIINRFLGTIANAAYGISLQLSGAVHFVAQSISNSMSPQITKAEGAGDRDRMLHLAESASKFTFLMMSLVGIPIICEMPAILHLWLGNVPDGAVMFCQFVLATSICDQLTSGLILANQAVGNIRAYALTINTIKVLTVPAAYICLRLGLPTISVMWFYVGFEVICALTRLPFLKFTAGLSIRHFVRHVFLRILFPTIVILICALLITHHTTMDYRFIITFIVSVAIGAIGIWFTGLEVQEKEYVINFIKTKVHKV